MRPVCSLAWAGGRGAEVNLQLFNGRFGSLLHCAMLAQTVALTVRAVTLPDRTPCSEGGGGRASESAREHHSFITLLLIPTRLLLYY